MAELKPGWRWVKLGDVALNSTVATKDPVADGFERYIIGKHIPSEDARITTWNPVGDAEFGSRIRTIFHAGDVICTTRGPYLKVAVPDFDGLSAHTNFILRTKDPLLLLQPLLEAVVRSDGFQEHLRKHFRGSTNLFVNWSDAAQYEFSLPPLEEQWRCVRALQAFARCEDAFRMALSRAEELRKAIEAEMIVPPGVRLNADHTFASVPAGWRIMSIREMCDNRSDITIGPFGSNLLHSDYAGRSEGVPVIFVRDIEPNNFTYRSSVFVSREKAEELSSHVARPGDIVITKVGRPESAGTPPGQAAVVPSSFPEAVITADVIRVRVSPMRANPEFLAHALNSPIGRQLSWRIAPGSTTRFKINATNFASVRLALPSIEQQEQIVARMQSLFLAEKSLRARQASLRSVTRRFLSDITS